MHMHDPGMRLVASPPTEPETHALQIELNATDSWLSRWFREITDISVGACFNLERLRILSANLRKLRGGRGMLELLSLV